MAEGFIHTVPTSGRWCNRVEGQELRLIPGIYERLAEALEAGRAEAIHRETAHVVHSSDGSIVQATNYDHVPALTQALEREREGLEQLTLLGT